MNISVGFIRSILTTFAFSFVGLSAVLAQPVLAQTSSLDQFIVQPEITPEQHSKIEAIYEKFNFPIQSALTNYNNSLEEFKRLIGTNPSSEEIRNKRQAVLEQQQKLRDLIFDRTMAVRDILTEEQRISIADYMREQLENPDY